MSFDRAEAQWEEMMYTKHWDIPNREAFDQDEKTEKKMAVEITRVRPSGVQPIEIELSTEKAFCANSPVFISAHWEQHQDWSYNLVVKGETARDEFDLAKISGPLDELHVLSQIAAALAKLGIEVEGAQEEDYAVVVIGEA